jgi:hypothetical protein
MRKPGENMPPKAKKAATQSVNSGSKLSIDVREPNTNHLKEFLASHTNLTLEEDIIGLFKEIVPAKLRGKPLTLNTNRILKKWEPKEPLSSSGFLTFEENNVLKRVAAYQKMIPLIDPYYWLRYKERPSQPFLWNYQKHEIVTPENQGYVDCVASSLASKLKGYLNSPHFCDFYGAFRAVADVFYYNMEDDFEDFRFTRWFWKGLEAGEYGIRVIEKSSGRRLTLDEIKEFCKPDEEHLHDDEDDEDDSESKGSSRLSQIEAENLPFTEFETLNASIDLEEVQSIKTSDDIVEIHKNSSTFKSSGNSECSFTEEYTFHAELYKMPVSIMYLEQFDGTMDDLIEMADHSPVKTEEQEMKWSAWLFQICAACSQLQNSIQLTHNDLHSCNVLWKKTEEEYLYYSDSVGRKWKVPTFGYIFSIIDYGRAIFYLNNFVIVSSDYNDGHDAAGMYNFGPIEDEELPKIYPNKSFDLCRLACSLLRGLFPQNPPSKPKGSLLTKEGAWEVRETDKPLFNLIWTWLRTKKGESILETEFGEEKYPGFDLYSTIATEAKDAVPSEQFKKSIFQKFLAPGSNQSKYIVIPL